MDVSERVERALAGLAVQDLECRVRAIEELAACSSIIAGHVASAFEEDEEARFLIFERLGRFGSLMIEPLERVYREAGEPGLKLMSASALTYLGSYEGISSLLEAIKAGNPNLCMAALSLSAAGVSEAVAPIENVLLECDLSDVQALECLVSSLRRLNHPMSENVRLRLSLIEPKWLRDSLLE
ncbi:HEAT repeat domain-containing protein [Streptomyces sp. WAC06614]|uniref:HEAT repeat domain-containing protein n=1 Tax=Streptomyces sp. WAC06614 TaxID=2487416 RepID=UPI000F791B2E|nr:HEAT repeat domain-containing protein [Streptomyces sp. WAC06614]RSS83978.1 HEAT repeat domain-containing protein [Streptomyces sp. WAC06614]